MTILNPHEPVVLRREICHGTSADGTDKMYHVVRGRLREVGAGHPEPTLRGIAEEVVGEDGGIYVRGYPTCPDCDGGEILWAENGHVPGSRECRACGSRWADMRYHADRLAAEEDDTDTN